MPSGGARASVPTMRNLIIAGAGGRDFHDFNVLYRDDPDVRVVAFTAAQIPGIDDRVYPPALAGAQYPDGIPVHPEAELPRLIAEHGVDEVVFAYSDLPHEEVMHRASLVLAAGAGFAFSPPRRTMLRSTKPVVAVCATRTGAGKSQTTRRVGELLIAQGLRVALVRHPMPYHDLELIAVQRFATLADIDASNPTIEEREEYERPVDMGMVMYAGVDYGAILEQAQAEADVVIWDGGNNDLSFYAPDLLIVVADPLRAGDELRFHPGEANLRMADAVIVNKVDSASQEQVATVQRNIASVNPGRRGAARRVAGDPQRRTLARGRARARGGGRPDDHPRRHAVRRGHRRRTRRRSRAGGSPAVRDRFAARDVRALSAHRRGPSGDGLLGRAARGPRGDDRRDAVHRGDRRHADRPRAPDHVGAADSRDGVRARAARRAGARGAAGADRRPRPRVTVAARVPDPRQAGSRRRPNRR